MKICLVCNSELMRKNERWEQDILKEYSYTCYNCNLYTEIFSYGKMEVLVGDFKTVYYNDYFDNKINRIKKMIKQISEFYKLNGYGKL